MGENLPLLISAYQSNPYVFTPEEVDYISQSAKEAGIPFNRTSAFGTPQEAENYLLEVPKQLFGGFVEELSLGFINPVPESKNVYLESARAIGSLGGFIGTLAPGITTGRIAAGIGKGIGAVALEASAAAKGLKLARLSGALVKGGELAETAGAAFSGFRSPQMLVADKIVKSKAGEAALDLLKGSPKLQQMMEQGMHLGVASAVSNLKDGFTASFKAGISGAVFGGAFGAIGNMPFLKENTTIETIMKAAAGSLLQGAPATFQGAPVATQVREYLMGAYFGGHAKSAEYMKAYKWLSKLPTEFERETYKVSDAYRDLSPEQKAEVDAVASHVYKPGMTAVALRWVTKRLTNETMANKATADMNPVGTEIEDPVTKVKGSVTKVDQAKGVFTVMTEDGEKSISFDRAQKIADAPSQVDEAKPPLESDLAKALSEAEDFDPAEKKSSRIRNFITQAFRLPPENDDQILMHEIAVAKRMDELIQKGKTDENFNAWAEFKHFVQDIYTGGRENADKLKDEDFASLQPLWDERKQAIPWQFGVLTSGGSVRLLGATEQGNVYSIDHNLLASRRVASILHQLHDPTGEKGLIMLVDSASLGKGMKKGVSIRDVKFVTAEEMKNLSDYQKEKAILWESVFRSALRQGYYPYANLGDKPVFSFIRFHPNLETERKAVFERLFYGVDRKEFAKAYATGREFSKEIGLSPREYLDITASNLLYMEDMNGVTVDKMFAGWKDFVNPEMNSTQWAYQRGSRMTLAQAHAALKAGFELEKKNQAELARIKALPKDQQQAAYTKVKKDLIRKQMLTEMADGFWYKAMNKDARTAQKMSPQELDKVFEAWKHLGIPKPPKGRFIEDVLNFNKRQQPIFTTFLRVNPEMMKNGTTEIRTLLFHDYNDLKQMSNGKILFKEASDGGGFLRDDIFEEMAKARGIYSKAGSIKPFILNRSDTDGLLMGKLAYHRAGAELSEMMRRVGVDALLPTSAAKQYGNRDVYRISVEEGKLNISTPERVPIESPRIYRIPVEDHYLSDATYDNMSEKEGFPITLVKQLMTSMTDEQTPLKARMAYSKFLRDLTTSTPEASEALRVYLADRSVANLDKLVKFDKDGLVQGSLIEDMGIEDIAKGMRENTEFRERARAYILRVSSQGVEDGKYEFFADDYNFDAAEEAVGAAAKLLQYSDGSDAIAFAKPTSKLVEIMMTKYFIKRITNPKIRGAAKAILYPFAPQLHNTIDLNDEVFYAGRGFGNIRIKGITASGEEQNMTARQQFDYYEGARKALETAEPPTPLQAIQARWADILANKSEYLFHTAEGPKSGIEKKGLTAGGLSSGPEEEYGGWVYVFRKSDLPTKMRGRPLNDVALVKGWKPIKPIAVFSNNDINFARQTPGEKPIERPKHFPVRSKVFEKPTKEVASVSDTRYKSQKGDEYSYEDVLAMQEDLLTATDPQEKALLEKELDGLKRVKPEIEKTPLLEEMEKRLEFTIVRVPMDDISGARVLRLAGFLDHDGYTVLTSGQNMQFLGGADLDIDSVFIYSGLPKEVIQTLKEQGNSQRVYQEKYPAAEELFIRRANLPLGPKAPTREARIMGSVDALHRLKIGHEVSMGRNKMMGVSVSNKFLINSFYTAIVRAAGNSASYTLENDTHTFQFIPRRDNGEFLRAMASAAVHVAADVGKHGGMVDSGTMRSMLLYAAFDDVRIMEKKTGKTRSVFRGSNLDPVTGRYHITPWMRSFGARDIYSIPEFATLSDVNTKFYQWNYDEGRPWERNEVVASAVRFLEESKKFALFANSPFREVIDVVSTLEDRDGNLARAVPDISRVDKMFYKINNILHELDSKTKKDFSHVLFPFIEKGVKFPWRTLMNELSAIKFYAHYSRGDNSYGNIATEKGVRETAGDEERFDGLTRALAAAQKITKEQLENKWITSQNGRKSTAWTLAGTPNIQARVAFIREQRSRLSHFLHSRYADIASAKMLEYVWDRARIPMEETDAIFDNIKQLKDIYAIHWEERLGKTRAEQGEAPGSFAMVVNEYNRGKALMKEMDLKLALQDPTHPKTGYQDFYDAAFLSSITSEYDSSAFSSLPLEFVNPRVVKLYARMYREVFESVDKGVSKTDTQKMLANYDPNKAFSAEPKPEDGIVHTRILWPEGLDGVEMDKQTKGLAVELLEQLQHYNVKPEEFVAWIRHNFDVAQFTDLSYNQLKGLVYKLRRFRSGGGMFSFLFPKKTGQKGFPIGRRQYFQFPSTSADEMKKEYLYFAFQNVYDENGKLRSDKRPLKHANLQTGQLERVYASTAEPMVHISAVNEEINRSNSQREQALAQLFGEMEKGLGWTARGVVEYNTTTDRSHELFQYATFQVEVNGAERAIKEAQREGKSKEYIDAIKHHQANVLAEMKKHDAFYHEVKGKTFNISVPGKGTKVLGDEVLHMMQDSIQKYMTEEIFDKYIRMTDEWVGRNVSSKNGIIDRAKSFQDAYRMFRQSYIKPEDRNLSYDNARFMLWVDALHRKSDEDANTLGKKYSQLKPHEVSALNGFGGKIDFKSDIWIMPNSDRKYWLFQYLKAMRTGDATLVEEMLKAARERKLAINEDVSGRYRDLAIDALSKAWDHLKTPADGTTERKQEYHEQARDLMRYLVDKLGDRDMRKRLFGQSRYSQYDMDMAFAKGSMSAKEYWYKRHENENPFHETGFTEGYWPHIFDSPVEVRKWEEQSITEILSRNGIPNLEAIDPDRPEHIAAVQEIETIHNAANRVLHETISEDGGGTQDAVNEISRAEKNAIRQLNKLGGDRISGNMLKRQAGISGYSRSLDVLNRYSSKILKATYSNFAAFQARRILENFDKTKPMGEFTEGWSQYMREYVRASLGYYSVFSQEMMNDPRSILKSTPYYWLSDQAAMHGYTRINKIIKTLFNKEVKNLTPREREKFLEKLHGFSTLEGKYEMATLLFNARTAVSNVVGGLTNTWVYTGSRFMRDALKTMTWQRINPEWRDLSDVYKWAHSTGAFDQMVKYEGNLVLQRHGARWGEFMNEALAKLRHDPYLSDEKMSQIAHRYGIQEDFWQKSGFFMQKTERFLRINAFLASYLQAKSSMEPLYLEYDNPWLIEQAKRGVAVTQFLYDNANRPLFLSTNLGKVWGRFKLWSLSSIKFQRQIAEQARESGYAPGSMEMQRLQRLMVANFFAIGLASLLPFSLFDSGLPAPLSYFQNLADWLFGDDEKKRRAFFGSNIGIPASLAPLNELMPPISRLPKGIWDIPNTFGAIWGGETQMLSEYTSLSLIPAGRMIKDVMKAYQNPEMAADFLAGIPLHPLAKVMKQRRKAEQKAPPKPTYFLP